MQFILTQLITTAILASLAMVQAAPASKTDTADVSDTSPIGAQVSEVVPALEAPGVSIDGDVNIQDFNVGTVWVDANRGGAAGNINVDGIPSGCRRFLNGFDNSISSIQVNSGIRCVFYVNTGCTGAAVTVQNGGYVADLRGTNFQDNISSVSCFAS